MKNWFLEQFDAHKIFLHDDLNDEVYMSTPLSLIISNVSFRTIKVSKLLKSIYGLKKSRV